MDTQQQHQQLQKTREEKKVEDKKQEGKDPPPPPSSASPPSSSSSPAHEFSFTISLHSSSTAAAAATISDKTKPHPPPPHPFAIDLSPADDIFFHGHLLPLHLLSHLPVSPRSSTNSIDSFTLPIRELIDDQKPIKYNTYSSSSSNSNTNSNSTNNSYTSFTHHHHQVNYSEIKGRPKSKTFSLFGLTRGRKEGEVREKEEKEEKHKRKLRFDMSRVLKRYVRMVRPLLFFRGRREKIQLRRQPYSFSGNLSFRGDKQEMRGRRGEFSAPASMRTSPTNSGLLVATAGIPSSTSDSTMEELQAAIQAAIAHCKNSIAVEEKLK